MCIEYSDMQYTVMTKEGSKKILNDLSGVIPPGHLTAIMGPSGSGKSTFLNVLSGRTSSKSKGLTSSVELKINGRPINPIDSKSEFAYVMSDDALLATSTPNESISFAARLRIPGISTAARKDKVDRLIGSLGLAKCQNSLVGNENIKGISSNVLGDLDSDSKFQTALTLKRRVSGERKRTAVAVELVHDPPIVFLDEPTSGLDSFSAYKLVTMLKELNENGRCVVATIHQPSSEVFHLFDDVLFLWEGYCIYHGPVNEVEEYFGNLGHSVPESFNPADYVLFLTQTLGNEEMKLIAANWAERQKNAAEALECSMKDGSEDIARSKRSSFLVQFTSLWKRDIRGFFRDTNSLRARFGFTAFLNLLFGFIYLNSGGRSSGGQAVSKSHIGALTLLAINNMFAQGLILLLTFPLERATFLREYVSGMYNAGAYFLSKSCVEMPVAFIQTGISVSILYNMMGFNGPFLEIWFAVFLLASAIASTAVMAGCVAPNPKTAMESGPLLFVPQILFAGFFVDLSQVPSFLRWVQYLCSMKYAMNLLFLAEFSDHPGVSRNA
ncbi:hypothetical protein FOL47_003603 [Perkinsus chesapeaki]|uniref:ABC transporter domain-containing protein n=1 Tax=Perkinsus chesapeaki TaxID=330153 RepID=A0A7J6M746_PERCH|nr:hypothetical protein FOL47_003603 [Perkinsus chesapeaki]